MNSIELISAKRIWCKPGCLLSDAAILIENGRIQEIGPRAEFRSRNIPETHYPHHLLTPGLINAHTHLELGYMHNTIPPKHFVDWVVQLMSQYPKPEAMADAVRPAIASGVQACLQAGVTTIGDITKQTAITREALASTSIRAVSFGELQAIGARRHLLAERLAVATNNIHASDRLTIGISPHAPYTLDGEALHIVCCDRSTATLPLCMHLAELPEERDFLRDLSGRLREPYNVLGSTWLLLDQSIPRHPGGPVAWAKKHDLLDRAAPTLLAHVNYADDADLHLLAQNPHLAVAYCPRTRRFFGHDDITPHRYRDMLSRGINVCLATDSLASNPDLNLLHEAQLLYQRDNMPPEMLLRMITENPARALGLTHVGQLVPHATADLAIFEADSLDALIREAPPAAAAYIAGKRQL